MIGLIALGGIASPMVQADQSWDGDNPAGNFSYTNNWFGDSDAGLSGWGFGNGNLVFAYRNNASQTSLYFDYGGWKQTNDVIWDTTFGAGLTWDGSGQGLDFNQRLNNLSSFNQVVGATMNLSGAKNGATQIELNPVNGNLTLNGAIFNDNSKPYYVYGNNGKILTVNTALGVGGTASSVSFNLAQNSTVIFGANQTYAGGTNISAGTLQVGNGGTTGSLGSGSIVNNGTLAYSFNSSTTLSLPSASLSGSGNLTATAGVLQLNGNMTLGGSQSFTQTGASGLYKGIESVAASTTITASAITMTGDLGKRNSAGNTVVLDTSAANGAINLNASIGRSGVWYNLSGFTANAGTGAINVTGTNGYGQWDSPVSLTGALNITTNLARTGPAVFHATAASTISGNLGLNQSIYGFNDFNVDSGVTMTVSGKVDGVSSVSWGGINKLGAGTLSLTNATNGYGQGLQINAGTVEFSNNALRPHNPANTSSTGYAADFLGSGTLRWGAGNSTDISTSGQVKIGDGVTATFDTNGSSPTFATAITVGTLKTGALTKAGAGTLTLSAANTYTGATTVNGGTLAYQNAYASTSHSIASGATLEFNVASGTADRAATTFSGAGTLTKTGAGTLVWGAAVATFNLASGAMIDVQAGTFTASSNANDVWTNNKSDLNVASGAVFDGVEGSIFVDALTGSGTIKSGYSGYPATITFGVDNGSGTFSGVLANSSTAGNFTKAGTGTQTLAAATTYTGVTTVSGGKLVYQNAYASPTHSISSGATLEFNVASGTADRAATTFSGAGTLLKSGAGILRWSGTAATFSLASGGLIDVQGGTFEASNSANEIWTNNKADLNVASGATFDGVEGAIFVDALSGSGTIKSGYSGYPSTITFGVDNGSGTFSGVLANSQAAGNFTKAGSGTQTLANSNTYTGATIVNGGVLNLAANQTIKLGNTLTVNTGATVNLAAAGDAVRDLSSITLNGGTLADTSATANHNHAIMLSAGRTLNMQNGASIIGTGAAAGHSEYGQIFLGYGGTTVNVTGTPASTWNADIRWGSASGSTTINIAGGASLIVAGHLGNFEGSQWGYLNLTGSGTLIMTDGTGSQNTPTIGANATMQIGNGGTTGDLPNVGGAGGVTNNGTLSFNRSNAYTPVRPISGSGQVVQNGGGTVTLSQANTYTGGTVVNSGTLKAGIVSVANTSGAFGNNSAVTMANTAGATLDITGYNTQIGSLTGGGATGGNVTLGAATLTTGGNNTSPAAYAGTISGTGGVTKIGTGVQTFSGNNSYTGVTTVSAGVLKLDSAGALPGGIGATGGTGALAFNGGVIGLGAGDFNRGPGTGSTQVQWTGSGGFAAYTLDRTVNLGGSSAAVVWNSGNFVPTGSNLILGAASADKTVTFANPIDLGGVARTVQVDNGSAAVDGILSGVLSGAGGLTKTGAGTLQLGNDNTFTGALAVSGGTLSLADATATIKTSSGVAISSGATLLISNTSAVNNTDRLNNAGTVTMTGGTLNFSHTAGAANYSETTGALSITSGANTILTSQADLGQTSILTFASLSISGGSLNFSGTGLGLTDQNQIKFTTPPSLDGSGLIANAFLNGNANVTYSINDGVVPAVASASIAIQSGVIPNGYISTVSIDSVGSPGPITLATPTTTINTLTQNYTGVGGTVDMAGQTLRMSTATILAGKSALTFGAAPGSGTLMARDPGGELVLANLSSNPLTVNAVVADNLFPSTLTKTGTGTLVLAGAASYTGATALQEGTLQLAGVNRLPTGTILTLGAGSSSGILMLDGNSQILGGLTTSGSGSDNRVVNGNATAATITIGGSTTFAGVLGGPGANENNLSLASSGAPTLTGSNTFTGDVTIGINASLTVPVIATSGPQPLGQAASAINFQGNVNQGSTLVYSGSGAGETNRALNMASGQGGTVNVSQAAAVLTVNGSLTGASDFHKSGSGTLVLTASDDWSGNGAVDGGTLVIGTQSGIGNNSISGGNWDVASGATLRINTTGSFEAPTITRNGTFRLEAGTLRTNAIAGTGAFVWGNGTISTLGNNTMGLVDRTDPAGPGSGPVVKEGNILNFTGNLATSVTSGQLSSLDLGSPYLNDGLRYNQIKVSGTLDLSGADTLRFAISPYLLRPTSASSVITGDWGTLRMVMADSILGTFDNIIGISQDNIGWSQFGGPFTSAADLPLNSYFIEYVAAGITDESIQAGAAILFHYKVAGTVPEPASAGLMAAGVFLLRAMARRRRKGRQPGPALPVTGMK